jgi:ADP-ribose pyrophosphatase
MPLTPRHEGTPAMQKQPADARQLVYDGKRVKVYQCQVARRSGGSSLQELVDHPGSVVILPLVADEQVCLIRNWRYSAQASLWELPAGTLEPGEPTLQAAQRELAEETGFSASSWRLLSEFWVSPGVFAEKMWIYLARGLQSGPQKLDETEEIETAILPWDEAVRMALQGAIVDAKTLVGILLWEKLRHDQ